MERDTYIYQLIQKIEPACSYYDLDGICGDVDECPYDDENDADDDGACAGVDICPGENDFLDNDEDNIPDCIDICPFDPNNDFDGDGLCCGKTQMEMVF